MTRKKVNCDKCHDRGYTFVAVPGAEELSDFDYAFCLDYNEAYCDCPRGVILREKDGG